MTGKKTLKERETENTRGRKRYLERLQEEKEAKQEQEEELDELVRKNGEWGWYDEQRSDK
jgi:hypothetical protein